jgi:hypothetical protein
MSVAFLIAVIAITVIYQYIYGVRMYYQAKLDWRNEHQGEEGTFLVLNKRARKLCVEKLLSGDIGSIVAFALWLLWPVICTAVILKLGTR